MKNELVVSNAGRGKAGYCKICASSVLPKINKMAKGKLSASKIIDYAAEFGLHLSKPTIYNHIKHITDPRVTFVARAQANPAIKPSNPRQLLESIVDLAGQRIMDAPDEVTVDHGLEASKLLMKENRGPDVRALVMVKVMTGKVEEVIEGDYTEV